MLHPLDLHDAVKHQVGHVEGVQRQVPDELPHLLLGELVRLTLHLPHMAIALGVLCPALEQVIPAAAVVDLEAQLHRPRRGGLFREDDVSAPGGGEADAIVAAG